MCLYVYVFKKYFALFIAVVATLFRLHNNRKYRLVIGISSGR